MVQELSPDLLLRAYRLGVFPMAERRDDPEVRWIEPYRRGVLPLDGFRISRSLDRRLRAGCYRITVDTDFAGVVDACADRPETWINPAIRAAYLALHAAGHAHALEVRDPDSDALIGGVYGVMIGAAFFGESMFSRRTDASKIALAFLTRRLRTGGFVLFDTQFLTPHLASLGAEEISRAEYRRRLASALERPADFDAEGPVPLPYDRRQRSTQTS
jgi:leucyl/phenylalanyl-tRNA---protein transferase